MYPKATVFIMDNGSTDSICGLICERCWNGPFAFDSFQVAWRATTLYDGFSYTSTWKEVEESAIRGCKWCCILQDSKDGLTDGSRLRVTVGFSRKNKHGCTPKNVETLRLSINGVPKCSYYVYTESGKQFMNSRYIIKIANLNLLFACI